MIVAIWIVAALLLGLWSLAAWGMARLLDGGGAWVAEIGPQLGRLPFGHLLERWFPTWQQDALQVLEALQGLLDWLGGAAPVIVWSLWTAGALLIGLLAAALTLLVALVRRHARSRAQPRP